MKWKDKEKHEEVKQEEELRKLRGELRRAHEQVAAAKEEAATARDESFQQVVKMQGEGDDSSTNSLMLVRSRWVT